MKEQEEYKKLPFPFKNNVDKIDYEKVDLSKHLIGKYYDKHNNVVAFFDNVFPKEFVDAVRTYYTHYESALGYNSYDPGSSETHDNVNWIMQINVRMTSCLCSTTFLYYQVC